jgi:serine/threonine-protein kinase HipA
MKTGGEYRLRDIGPRHWGKLATELHLDPNATIQRVRNLATQLADTTGDVSSRMTEEGVAHSMLTRLAHALTTRGATCRKIMIAQIR